MLTFQDEAEMRKYRIVIDPCDPSRAVPIGQLTDRQQTGTFSEITERHMEHGSVQSLAEHAEDDAAAGAGGASSPANHESSQLGNNVEPNATWNLDRLAAFIHRCLRRTAQDAWLIGKALDLAHKQLTEDRDWLRWLKDIRISKSAAYRFLDLFENYSLEEIQARPCDAVDRLLKELKADNQTAGRKKENTATGDRSTAKPAARKLANGSNDADTSAAEENEAENGADNGEENADREEEQLPITADECEALRVFVLAVGGWARAEYVLRNARQVEDVDE